MPSRPSIPAHRLRRYVYTQSQTCPDPDWYLLMRIASADSRRRNLISLWAGDVLIGCIGIAACVLAAWVF